MTTRSRIAGQPAGRRAAALFFAGVVPSLVLQPPSSAQQLLRSWEGEAAQDWFGHSVAFAGDLDGDERDDVLVGALQFDGLAGADTGKAYAYSGATGDLLWSWEGDSARGLLVAGGGDVDGDGRADVLIASGEARVYSGASGQLLRSWPLPVQKMAGAGDIDGDGLADVIITAQEPRAHGVVRVHSGASGALLLEREGATEYYGRNGVAGGGDLDGDGQLDVAVADTRFPQRSVGTVYALDGATGDVAFTLRGGFDGDELGIGLDVGGDRDGDGRADLVVGSMEGFDDPGQVELYVNTGTRRVLLWQWAGAHLGEELGQAVSGRGDADADGTADVVAGARGHVDAAAREVGAAYLLSGTGELLWLWEGEQAASSFGTAVDGGGDANGDGHADVLVGAHLHAGAAGPGGGKVFLYAGGPSLHAELTADATCLTACPGGSIVYRATGTNPTDVAADLIVELVSPAVVRLLDEPVPPGPFTIAREVRLPPAQPTTCPATLELRATLTTDAGVTLAETFAVEALPEAQPDGADAGTGTTVLHAWFGEASGDELGCAVAGAGDVDGDGLEDVVVGAPEAVDGQGTRTGRAYVFAAADGDPLLRLTGIVGADHFGRAVAGAGDVDGDGVPDLVVGATGAHDHGRADVRSGADGSVLWRWEAEESRDWLGNAVDGGADVDGDGRADVLVGAIHPFANSGRSKVHLYSGATGAALAVWYGDGLYSRLGAAVAFTGDADGDGIADVAVGADGDDAVYVYSGATSELVQSWSGAFDSAFGFAVDDAGDVDADGIPDLVVGAPEDAAAGAQPSGIAYLYSGTGALLHSWLGEAEGDRFGASVAGGRDADGDGIPDVVIGADRHAGPPGEGSGRAYVYSGATGELLHVRDGQREGDGFGSSVDAVADVDGDGLAELLAGACGYDGPRGADTGAAFLARSLSLFADGPCLATCPGPSVTYRLRGNNASAAPASVELALVDPAFRGLLAVEVPPGSFEIVDTAEFPPSQPPFTACPLVLTFRATLTDAGGTTLTETFAVEAVRRE